MAFIVSSKLTGQAIEPLLDVREALIAERSGFRVQGNTKSDIIRLAKYRCEVDPANNSPPDKGCEWCEYLTNSGYKINVRILRCFKPDDDGCPTMVELLGKGKDGPTNFYASIDRITLIDTSAMSDELERILDTDEICDGAEKPVKKATRITVSLKEMFRK